MQRISRALISCTDKTGLVELGRCLHRNQIQILSTGGTAKALREHDIPVTEVSDYTGSPEILDGRVKTLHPKIHGGLLGIRSSSDHQQQMKDNSIEPIDLVVVNLYEFEKTIANDSCTLDDAIENIDIGGPSMLRSAAKNYKFVTVVTSPSDYPELIRQIEIGGTTEEFRFTLAQKVFALTASYDSAIASYLSNNGSMSTFPDQMTVTLKKIQNLRYGENPHQKAAFYREVGLNHGIVNARQWQGKELSFNNILDLESAFNCCREYTDPSCVIVKHLNPCGIATAPTAGDAFIRAREADPVSCFGGIVAFNTHIDQHTALLISETFFEAVIAPSYDPEAMEIFNKRKNLRIMTLEEFQTKPRTLDFRRIGGGMLVQDMDVDLVDLSTCQIVTRTKPTPAELADLQFAWKAVKHVKSNAIVFAKNSQTLGIGAGQMSRIDSVKIAAMKANEYFKDQDILKSSVLASDAFFPFRDGVDEAAKFGIKAIVQPGGSLRDNEVIEACDQHGIAMIFTGMRHFRH